VSTNIDDEVDYLDENPLSIEKLQDIDPIALAEELTGKGNDMNLGMALGLMQEKNRRLNLEYSKIDDTCFRETPEEYMRKVKSMGFEEKLLT